jgi:hypothetical protein
LNQVLDAPINADPRKKGDQTKEERKNQRLFKEETVIEDISQFFKLFDADAKGEKKGHQDGHWNQIEENKFEPFGPFALLLERKNKGEVKKEKGSKSQSDKDHLYPPNGPDRIDAIDHDQFAQVPGGEGENKTGKKFVAHVLRVAREDDQTKDQVHGKGKSRRKR